MWNTLPNLTSISARDANPIGGFGLVVPGFTNTYHTPDLALTHGCMTFTNHYHRGLGQGIDVSVVGERGWVAQCGVCYVGLEWWHTIRSGTHHMGRYRKDFLKIFFFGRIAFYEHGGKSGMATIKYPGYRKNAQGQKRALYPGLTTVSL